MDLGEFFMRATIALSVIAYAGAEVLWFRRRLDGFRWRAILWTAAAGLCIIHSALAFHVRHDWSHAEAVRQTAAQTAALTGLDWGGGVVVNYAFLAIWAADVVWTWAAPAAYLRRSRIINAALSGFFLFIVFNGAVVFARGPARAVGIAATLTVVWAWWTSRDAWRA